jgi:hypothetical protein
LFALSTHLAADAAVLVMMRVPLALVAAVPTSFDASLKSYAGDVGNELGLPAEDTAGRDADVAAVQAERNARNQRLEIGLAQVGVSAGCTALSAVEACVDAGDQRTEFDPECPRMRLQDLSGMGHDPSFHEPLYR